MLDSARIDTDHAAQEYTRTLYNVKCRCLRRYRLENSWRQQKDRFQELHLSAIIEEIETCQFGIRSGMRAGLEASLDIIEDGIPIRDRGKGRQCFIKTELHCAGVNSIKSWMCCCLKSRKNTSAM